MERTPQQPYNTRSATRRRQNPQETPTRLDTQQGPPPPYPLEARPSPWRVTTGGTPGASFQLPASRTSPQMDVAGAANIAANTRSDTIFIQSHKNSPNLSLNQASMSAGATLVGQARPPAYQLAGNTGAVPRRNIVQQLPQQHFTQSVPMQPLFSSAPQTSAQHPYSIAAPTPSHNNYSIAVSNHLELFKHLSPFDGKNMHPVAFVNRIEQVLTGYNVPFMTFALWAPNFFTGDAKIWSDAVLCNCRDFASFKSQFLAHFWDSLTQVNLRNKLECGRYVHSDGSYTNYFLNIISNCRYLDPPLPESVLILTVARHYPPSVGATLLGVHTVTDALARLRQADFVLKTRPVEYANTPSRQNFRSSAPPHRVHPPAPRVAPVDVDDLLTEVSGESENFGSSTA